MREELSIDDELVVPAGAARIPRRSARWGRVVGLEIGLLAIAVVLPAFLGEFWVLFATRVLVLGLMALSFDLVWGYAGILSFGQALFFGVAGYACALVATKLDIQSVLVIVPLAAAVGLVVSSVMAAIVVLGKRPYTVVFVSLGTLTGSYVVERLARGWSYVGGQNGIPSLPRLTLAGNEIAEGPAFYYMALVLLVLVYVGLRLLTRSQFGLVLAGLRQHEPRLAFLGYRTQDFKALVFCLAGAIAGLSGALYAFHEGFVGPGQLGPVLSTQVVLYALFGGVGTLIGPVIGTGLVDLLGYGLSRIWETGWPIALGLLLLLIVMFRPSGLMGFVITDRERIGSFGRSDDVRGG